ncbi:MAG: metallophosphoesterase [Candidatus Eremiobacteraeota bacterium]|nr:metallophosphoesterase [Candidatus Eremiobacteraeota bacterium]MCW5872078.1 metallophosphoesterase [Candidatus Eremiobacteraeota bacterium]
MLISPTRMALLLALSPLAGAEPNLARLRQLAAETRLQKPAYYLQSAAKARPIFQKQGGLVTIPGDVPTLILPDLHAQRDYLVAALAQKIEGKVAFELLRKGKLNVLCLGDAMHSEQRRQMRWMQAEQDYLEGRQSLSLEAEITESLGLMVMIFELKTSYPGHFYFVRGNHEDMDPERAYSKFTRVGESNLVKSWVRRNWGDKFLRQWAATERSLPLMASGGSFVGSHAPPEREVTAEEVHKRTPEAFRALCWSDNTQWKPGSSEERAFLANCRRFQISPTRPWVAGHRKVTEGLYRSQLGGKIIQINPIEGRVMIVAPAKGRPFESRKAVRPVSAADGALPTASVPARA